MNQEVFSLYVVPVIITALTALAGYLGTKLKGICEKYINDKTKERVARTCVKAVEQLYHDLSGEEKLKKASEGIVEMLNDKGIPISELELNMLIESVVAEFNYGFNGRVAKEDKEQEPPDQLQSGEYSEEGGGK